MRTEAWLRAVVFVSLAVNLFLGGLLLGGHVSPGRAGFAGFAPNASVRRLSADDRARWRSAVAPHRAAVRAARAQVRSARAGVLADLTAPSLDRQRLNGDLSALRTATSAQQAAAHEALVDGMAALPPASRLRLIASLPPLEPGGVGKPPPVR